MTREEMRKLSFAFCDNACGVNKRVDCDGRGVTCIKLAEFLLQEKSHRKENLTQEELIDKACDAYCQVCGHYPHKVPTHICRQDCDYYMKFRKAMSNCGEIAIDKLWHKASEELPMYNIAVVVAYSKCDWDICFNHRSNNPEVKTTKNGWCDVGFDGEPIYWMYIPEIKED